MKLLHGHGRYQSGQLLRGYGMTGTAIEALATRMTLANVTGLWFDPSDTDTLFQDSTGASALTATGQTLGLILDKFQWNGKSLSQLLAGQPELAEPLPVPTITNLGGSAGAWDAATQTLSNTAVGTDATYPRFSFALGLTAGKFYKASVTFSNAAPIGVTVGSATGPALVKSGSTWSGIVSADGAALFVTTNGTATFSSAISSITVKHIPGHHASQSDAAKKPKYRRGDSRGVVNLLTWSEDFANAAWVKAGGGGLAPTVTANAVTAPDGSATADQVSFPAVSGAGAFSIVYQAPTQKFSTAHSGSVYLRGSVGGEAIWLMWTADGTTYTRLKATLSTEWQRFDLGYTTSASGTQYYQIGVDLRDTSQTATAAQTVYAWGGQLEQASTASSYQRNDDQLGGILAYTKADLHWLAHDLVDDALNYTVPDLGTNVTIATAFRDNVEILTGQTVTAGTKIVPQKEYFYGYFLAATSLSASQTSVVSSHLSKKSGN